MSIDYDKINSVLSVFDAQVHQFGDKPYLWRKVDGKYASLSWKEVHNKVCKLSLALSSLGILRGDRVIIVSENRPEWQIADLAIMAIGAITVPAYITNTTADHEYILKHSGARALIVSNNSLTEKVLPAVLNSPNCKSIIKIEEDNFSNTPGGVYTIGFIRAYSKYLGLNSSELIKEYKAQISESEIIKPIELQKPLNSYYSPYKIASFFTVILVSLVFYKLFISEYNSQPEYALTPDLPENLEITIEENDVKIALSNLKKDKITKNVIQNQIDNIDILTNTEFQNNTIFALASKPKELNKNDLINLISINVIKPTWIQIIDSDNNIIISKLMKINDVYNYSINDNFLLTTGNAGNIIVSIGDKVMGKLGKQGEVLDSITILPEYFSN